ncbi:hypothetical protein L226DRAFT_2226 [Lentinus tigrinus ALCF2SS1-7]|uniref:uncharacterized protein n=1 Tax=Lentinus tigrinus ALCF2SS1-7 TaxID=1328758 RepID=UPI001165E00F|nr:hypothetical protein L226DRAFT_2226 [Lentinus tigrinus ALCF2SS1-7]
MRVRRFCSPPAPIALRLSICLFAFAYLSVFYTYVHMLAYIARTVFSCSDARSFAPTPNPLAASSTADVLLTLSSHAVSLSLLCLCLVEEDPHM